MSHKVVREANPSLSNDYKAGRSRRVPRYGGTLRHPSWMGLRTDVDCMWTADK